VIFEPKFENGLPEVTCEQLHSALKKVKIVDVRRPDEFVGEYGHIPGAELVTLGPELDVYLKSASKDAAYVFVCRSGARSGNATIQAQNLGFREVYNMQGGMIRWTELKYVSEK
jgi:rhodanese-related sulfurtransferase